MVQGDDPMLKSQMIEAVVKTNNHNNEVTNICNKIKFRNAKDLIE